MAVVSDWITVQTAPQSLVMVTRGLLESNEIPCVVEPAQAQLPPTAYPLGDPMVRLRVPADRADEARLLLGEDVVDDAGDAGAE